MRKLVFGVFDQVRADNQTLDLYIDSSVPAGMSLANQTDSIEAASIPRKTGALQPDTDGLAVIVPEVYATRTSDTALVLPGDTLCDYSALLIK